MEGTKGKKKKDFKQHLFLVVNFCSQLFVSLSQSNPLKIPVEFFFSPCVSKITAVTRLRGKRRGVGYTVIAVKRLFQQYYRQIQGQTPERYFRHLKIKTSGLKHEFTELQVLATAHPELLQKTHFPSGVPLSYLNNLPCKSHFPISCTYLRPSPSYTLR